MEISKIPLIASPTLTPSPSVCPLATLSPLKGEEPSPSPSRGGLGWLVHAKDEVARQWYESWEFEPSPTDFFQLFLMLKNLKSLLGT